MNISSTNLLLPVSDKLTDLIKEALKGKDFTNKTRATLNFRDPDYSAEKGGFHPEYLLFAIFEQKSRVSYSSKNKDRSLK